MARFKVGDRIRDKEHKFSPMKIVEIRDNHYIGSKGGIVSVHLEDEWELVSNTYNPVLKKLSSEGDSYRCEIEGLSESQYHVLQDLIDSWSV